ncbi:MAG: protein translocase subunit SecD [Pseudomonadota bacterium]|jgi:preprotein translocase subunit SecD
MNQYPTWRYLAILGVLLLATLYALPNLYGEEPAVQISPAFARDAKIDESTQQTAEEVLKNLQISPKRIERDDKQMLIRFNDTDEQLKAYSALKNALSGFVVAQNLASTTPNWLLAMGAKPMYLGLDLRGGIHFLMAIDMQTAIRQDEERFSQEFRNVFREEKLRYKTVQRSAQGGVQISFTDLETRDKAVNVIKTRYPDLISKTADEPENFSAMFTYNPQALKQVKDTAIEQNLTTLRNRVNELGVAEPVIQRQGEDRIVVQLPGVQDTARAKEILGSTATLEFRLVGEEGASSQQAKSREGGMVWLKRSVIATGDQISHASSGVDHQSGRPAVMVSLDGKGAKRMYETTKENVKKPMAVLFIENKINTNMVEGKEVKTRQKVEEVINVATIQEAFGKNFQITGLDQKEAINLALLLRAGALKAPMEIVEERTVGPSLGKENIRQGVNSILVGFFLVVIMISIRYKSFGIIANTSLLLNVIMLISLLSLIQATLTLPGLAGILLTIGMAIDANVLIFERIREEIKIGNSPQACIYAGFEKAWATILDSNVTTLIGGLALFSFGTGPVKGFAITLCLGILTSMFTAVTISRALVNWFYGGRKLTKLSI